MFCMDYVLPAQANGLKARAMRFACNNGKAPRRLMPVTVPLKHGIPTEREKNEILEQLRQLKAKRQLRPTIARPLRYGFETETGNIYVSLGGDIHEQWLALLEHLRQMGYGRKARASNIPRAILLDGLKLLPDQVEPMRRSVEDLELDMKQYFPVSELVFYRPAGDGWADIEYLPLN